MMIELPILARIRAELNEAFRTTGQVPMMAGVEEGRWSEMIAEMRTTPELFGFVNGEPPSPLVQTILLGSTVIFPVGYTDLINSALAAGAIVPCHPEYLMEQIGELIQETEGFPL